MKRIATLLLCLVQTSLVFGQQSGPQNTDKLSEYFREIKNATGKESKLWNKDLYGGILLVDTKSRQVYSNESDAKNSLTPHQDIYTGTLPGNINIANTSVQWNGKTWAMIMLPLSNDKYDRINLLAHELFHTVQSSLGFPQGNKESNHLDQKDGRVYLRLELEALEKAVLSDSQKNRESI